jgi:membrane protein insertase Oxa1/YidC/SpoIIIJ
MAFVSPAMIAYIGLKYNWASALILYWLSLNIFTMAQQLFLYRRYGLIGPKAMVAATIEAPSLNEKKPKNVTPAKGDATNGQSRNGRAKKRSLKR